MKNHDSNILATKEDLVEQAVILGHSIEKLKADHAEEKARLRGEIETLRMGAVRIASEANRLACGLPR